MSRRPAFRGGHAALMHSGGVERARRSGREGPHTPPQSWCVRGRAGPCALSGGPLVIFAGDTSGDARPGMSALPELGEAGLAPGIAPPAVPRGFVYVPYCRQ